MTYNEAAELIAQNIDELRSKHDLTIAQRPAIFCGLIVAPVGDLLRQEFIYNRCIKNGEDNKNLIIDLGDFGKEMNAFIIYFMNGREIILPLESYLQQASALS